MLSIASTCYHSISPTAHILTPPQPAWRPARSSHSVSLSHVVCGSMRWMSGCLTEDTTAAGGRRGTTAPDFMSPQHQRDGQRGERASVSKCSFLPVCLSLMIGDLWFSAVTGQVKVTGDSPQADSYSTGIVCMCTNKGRYWQKHCKSSHKQTEDVIALSSCFCVCIQCS